MTVLTLTTGLTSILVVNISKLLDCFLVSNLRCTYVSLNLELSEETVNDDIQVKLTHTCDNGLTCFFVSPCSEGRILFGKLCKADAHLFLTGLSLRLDSELDNRLGEFHGLEDYRVLRIAECITGSCILKTYASSDIAGVASLDILSVVGVHLKDTTHSFRVVLSCIEHSSTCVNSTRINSEVAELTNEGVSCNLECKCSERFSIGCDSLGLLTCIGVNTLVGDAAFTDALLKFFCGKLFTLKVFFHELVVHFSSSFNKLLTVFVSHVNHVSGNILYSDILAKVIVIHVCLHFNQVNDTLKVIFRTDRKLNGHCVTLETLVHHFNNTEEVGTHNIHLIYISHSGYLIFISLTPYGLRLGLNAALCAENSYRTVKNSKRTLNLYCKVNVAGGVDDIDSMACPVASSSSGGNCDTSLLLLSHPVHCCRTIVSFTYLMVYTGIEKDTLGGSCFTCIDVSHDTNISCFFK